MKTYCIYLLHDQFGNLVDTPIYYAKPHKHVRIMEISRGGDWHAYELDDEGIKRPNWQLDSVILT
jgi:hypothetical protein